VVRIVGGVVAIAFGVALIPAGAAGEPAGTLPRRPTLQRYQPILLFAKGEHWFPTNVAVFVDRAELQQRGRRWPFPARWTKLKQQRPLPTNAADRCKGPCSLNLPCRLRDGIDCYVGQVAEIRRAAPRTIYTELLPVRSPIPLPAGLKDRQPAYLARYWFFYYFDDWQWHSRGHKFTQAHEGDWEGITIGLDADGDALWAAYNQHCSGTWLKWEDVHAAMGDHALAYVGLGSHATYFRPDPRPTYPIQCIRKLSSTSFVHRIVRKFKGLVEEKARVVDATGTFNKLGPQEVARGTAKLVDLRGVKADWKTFDGIWGEDQYLYLGPRPGPLNAGLKTSPHTPKFGSADFAAFWHDRWT
jgi:hypothetical protein